MQNVVQTQKEKHLTRIRRLNVGNIKLSLFFITLDHLLSPNYDAYKSFLYLDLHDDLLISIQCLTNLLDHQCKIFYLSVMVNPPVCAAETIFLVQKYNYCYHQLIFKFTVLPKTVFFVVEVF